MVKFLYVALFALLATEAIAQGLFTGSGSHTKVMPILVRPVHGTCNGTIALNGCSLTFGLGIQ
jgi:hypothetical protein